MEGNAGVKIKLKSAGLPIGKNTRLREIDMDHARDLVEFCGRGYMIWAQEDHGAWALQFSRFGPDEGADWIIRPYRGVEDARLLDDHPPPWMGKLMRYVASIVPPHVHMHPPYALEENDDG